ncbi:hypothetical protein [uncultured Sulfurimonas sp.]|jgi:hypothetical protein|uniref:hypothetical protein n=1 Tax=uncultured Sulfurimonas sp. TaxID=291845 RepID=UPI0032B25FF2
MSEDFKEQKQHEIREKWAKYAKAKSEHAYLEHYRKSLMAILQKEYMASGHASVAAQEREARADVRYLEVLEGIKVSVEQEEVMRGECKMAEWQFEGWKARIYADQREAKRYGH